MKSNNTTPRIFGPAQEKLLKYVLTHPNCNVNEIHTDLFNDKKLKYTQNLLWENRDFFEVTTHTNENMPSSYQVKAKELAKHIDLVTWVKEGKFVRPQNQPQRAA